MKFSVEAPDYGQESNVICLKWKLLKRFKEKVRYLCSHTECDFIYSQINGKIIAGTNRSRTESIICEQQNLFIDFFFFYL